MDSIPPYSDLFQHVLDALKSLGGSGKPSEVRDLIAAKLGLSDESLETTTKSGTQLLMSRVYWARAYLAKTGYVSSSKRGVWSLTDKGREVTIGELEAKAIVTEVVKDYHETKKKETAEPCGVDDDEGQEEIEAFTEDSDHRSRVLELLLKMPADAFERLCQRLLRESGFEQVVVTGRSGDGGIDGHGVLQLNPFVSFRVLFQCKRYRDTVGSGAIRDFRGAMMGRAEKGIVLTTGTFSRDAHRESVRDGVPPIELVDGNSLVDLFETLEYRPRSQAGIRCRY